MRCGDRSYNRHLHFRPCRANGGAPLTAFASLLDLEELRLRNWAVEIFWGDVQKTCCARPWKDEGGEQCFGSKLHVLC